MPGEAGGRDKGGVMRLFLRRLDLPSGGAYLVDWIQEGNWTLFLFVIKDSALRAGATLNDLVGELVCQFFRWGVWVGQVERDRDCAGWLWEIVLRANKGRE